MDAFFATGEVCLRVFVDDTSTVVNIFISIHNLRSINSLKNRISKFQQNNLNLTAELRPKFRPHRLGGGGPNIHSSCSSPPFSPQDKERRTHCGGGALIYSAECTDHKSLF